MSNDVVSHKDVPFGGPKTNLHFDPISPHPPKKTEIWGQFSRDLEIFGKKALTVAMVHFVSGCTRGVRSLENACHNLSALEV